MARKINIYNNNPTAGLTDGDVVSGNGDWTNPIHADLDASQNEEQIFKCAIRTEAGYQTRDDTTIFDSNDVKDRWQLCKTSNGTFTDIITFSETIGNANVIFYVKARSTDTEYSMLDRSVKLVVDCQIEGV